MGINQYKLNKQIEDFIKQKDANNETYSDDDIAFIQQYEGSGGQDSKIVVLRSVLPKTEYF